MDREQWMELFREQSAAAFPEPFYLCLAEAIAAVESGWGERAIGGEGGGLNEIGYKAVPGKPSIEVQTHEAGADGALKPETLAFRLFADRREQASALAWMMRSSVFYEAARLLFVMAFYSAYAPGRTEGMRALLEVFNRLARSGAHPGVTPLRMIEPGGLDRETTQLNHEAARRAVRLFCELCGEDLK